MRWAWALTWLSMVMSMVNQHRPKYAIYIGHIERDSASRTAATSRTRTRTVERDRSLKRERARSAEREIEAAEFSRPATAGAMSFHDSSASCRVHSSPCVLRPASCVLPCARSVLAAVLPPLCAAGANRRLLTLTFCAMWHNSCSRCCTTQPAINTNPP